MSNITVIQKTQKIIVDPASRAVSVINEGPQGPGGPTGPSVPDGDKGDITVSGAGTVWTIDNGAITAAKVASDIATQAELDSHITDVLDAHDASAISIVDSGGNFTATDVESALSELSDRIDTLWVSAKDLHPTVGSAQMVTSGAIARHPGLAFDSNATESADSTLIIPIGWATINVILFWVQNAGGIGNVRWRCDSASWADGVLLSLSSGGVVTSIAASQYVVKAETVVVGRAISDGPLTIGIVRLGSDALDTLANDAILLGLRIDRAS